MILGVRLAIRIERIRHGLKHELDHGIGTAREAKKNDDVRCMGKSKVKFDR